MQTLTCVEVGQRAGNTSCTFEDDDIDPEASIDFLKSLDTLLKNNYKLKRVNIFYPVLMQHLDMFANIVMPVIFGTQLKPSNMLNLSRCLFQTVEEKLILATKLVPSP